MTTTKNRNGHSAWENGTCRFCGLAGADENRTCPTLKPRLAAREERALALQAVQA